MMAGYVLAKDLDIDVPEDYRFVWTDKVQRNRKKTSSIKP